MPETAGNKDNNKFTLNLIGKSYIKILTNLNFLRSAICMSGQFAAMVAWVAAGPFLIMEYFHLPPLFFGVLQALIFGSFIIGSKILSKFLEKYSLNFWTKLSINLLIFSNLVAILLFYSLGGTLLSFILPMFVISFACGIGFPIFNRLAIDASSEPMGNRMALFSSFVGFGGMLGSFLISSFPKNGPKSFVMVEFIIAFIITCSYVAPRVWQREQVSSTL